MLNLVLERCPSGRRSTPGKCVYVHAHRVSGFDRIAGSDQDRRLRRPRRGGGQEARSNPSLLAAKAALLKCQGWFGRMVEFFDVSYGEVSEWSKEHAWKVCVRSRA